MRNHSDYYNTLCNKILRLKNIIYKICECVAFIYDDKAESTYLLSSQLIPHHFNHADLATVFRYLHLVIPFLVSELT